MAAVHWYDTKGVHFLSTAIDPVELYGITTKRRQGGAAVDVPTSPIQLMYAENMRGVDTQDQYRAGFSTQIFTKKWWQKMYFFGFDSALTNSFIIHKHLCLAKGIKHMDHNKFQLVVAQALMGRPLPGDFGMARSECGPTPTTPCSQGEEDIIQSQESVTSHLQAEDVLPEVTHVEIAPPQPSPEEVMPTVGGNSTALPAVLNAPPPQIRCRRPNRRPHAPQEPAAPMISVHHYSKKAKLRQVCRQCRRRTKWTCPGCRHISVCPAECFVTLHRLLRM
jgi:hypothetical protein